jgi:predicted Zn-dependent protease
MIRAVGVERRAWALCALFLACATGCEQYPQGTGTGPGRRPQNLALTPNQELALGRQAFAQFKQEFRTVRGGPLPEQVERVGRNIEKASQNEPLQREINLQLKGYRFEWEFVVFENDQINAFCLPGGKVGVFTGLLRKLKPNDDQLAAVLSHEIAHALAHHASERLARENLVAEATDDVLPAVHGTAKLSPQVMSLLAPALSLRSLGALASDRRQESEADHIGVFLMAFAGYHPEQAVVFWERMREAGERGEPPEILSDHPSNARRIAQLRAWVPNAVAAKDAFDRGQITPP